MDQRQHEESSLTENPPPKRTKTEDDEGAQPSAAQQQQEEDLSSSSSSLLPTELQNVDFTQRVAWHKFAPYTNTPLPLHPLDAAPTFTFESPALCHYVHAISGRARACSVHLKAQPGQSQFQQQRPVPTPMFMPVGTKGCLKAVAFEELTTDPALQCPIILANTYHLAIQPGSELIAELGGLHSFQGLPKQTNVNEKKSDSASRPIIQPYNLLTDSGGFQMVSLVKLSRVTEEGVSFENPYRQQQQQSTTTTTTASQQAGAKRKLEATQIHKTDDHTTNTDNNNMLLLRPEDSIRHQNNIGANIIMALDDVISSVTADEARFREATHRTLRWYDRCYRAHCNKTQNLFPIVQGGIDTALGGLREQCLAGFRHRQLDLHYITPGYAIGGLAGGEEKAAFWRVVDQCCRALPDDKPRYLMGVGYPLDLVVCTALGVDLYDCVYPTRTARFGVALVDGRAPGTLRLKANECCLGAAAQQVIQPDCPCQACREGIPRSRLHTLFKTGNPVAVELLTQHNIAYMMTLVRNMRQAIVEDRFASFARDFITRQYPGAAAGGEEVPEWVVEALDAAGIDLKA